MNADEYLQRLQSQLKGFSPDEQAGLIEEIAAHIEEGENDPALGSNEAARSGRLERELGSPDDLGRRIRQVHRPGRWLDFFLVTLPTVLIFPLLPLVAGWITGLPSRYSEQGLQAEAFLWVSLRLAICVSAGLVIISRWKASPGVLINWLTSLLLAIVGLLLSEIRWPWMPVDPSVTARVGLPEAVFWLAALALLLAWLVRVVRAQRSEPLLFVLAVIPFLFAAANYIAGLTLRYYQIDQLAYNLPVIGWFGLQQIAGFVWPALFFLAHRRDLRWAGLLLLPITYVVYNLWPYHAFPLVETLYLLPLVLVLVAWSLDLRARLVPADR